MFSKPNFGISVSSDGTHFVDRDGKPFFWLGDTSWPLLTQYSPDEAKRYITRRGEQGFNVIQCVFAQVRHTEKGYSLPVANPHGDLPWKDNPAEPNPAFFDYAEQLVQHAAKAGVALAIIPTWGNLVVEENLFDEAKAYAYGLWLGKRFADHPNVVWMNGGDRLPIGYEKIWIALAKGLHQGSARQLITYHPTGSFCSSYFFHEEPWLDFNMIQTWGSWSRVYSMVVADRLRLPAKPVVLAEPAYEDGPEYPTGPITPAIVRHQAWWTHIAGGSYTYGQNQSWRMEPGWIDALESTGAHQMGVFRQIAESRPWWKMIPDQSLLMESGGSGRTLRAAMRTLDRTQALIYVPEPGFLSFCIDRIATPKVKATWIDPRNGKEEEAGVFQTENGQGKVFPLFEDVRTLRTPRFFEDSILALDGFA